MVEYSTSFDVYTDGESPTQEEYIDRQTLDVIRFMQALDQKEHTICERATAEEHHAFHNLLQQTFISVDGDTDAEWQEYQLHKLQQQQIIGALLHNPEGFESFRLFTEHIAPLYSAAVNRLHMPIEQLDREIVTYVKAFSTVLNDLTRYLEEPGTPIPYSNVMRSVDSQRRIIQRGIMNEVFASFASSRRLVLNATATSDQIIVQKHEY